MNPIRTIGAAWGRLARAEIWNIGIVDAPIAAFLAPGARPPVRWLSEGPRATYVADPFPFEVNGAAVILAEGFDERVGKGYIAALDPEGRQAPRTVITSPYHMSYPYPIHHNGRTYCIPETGTARAVRLYEAVAFPHAWEHRADLIAGFAALDATVFTYEGRWWLLCSEQDGTRGETLHAWHAPDLLGPWTPHAANPVKRDVGSARPAGTPFVHDGQLYRPSQDSTSTYGGAVKINRVIALTPTTFAEEAVVTVAPYADSPYPDGLHTLSAWGERTLIDAKRWAFVPAAFARRFRRGAGVLVSTARWLVS